MDAFIRKNFITWKKFERWPLEYREDVDAFVAQCKLELNNHLMKADPQVKLLSTNHPRTRDYWNAAVLLLPCLSVVGRTLCKPAATEGNTERVFSREKLIHTPCRNQLGPERMNDLLFIHGAYPKLMGSEPLQDAVDSDEELSDGEDHMDED